MKGPHTILILSAALAAVFALPAGAQAQTAQDTSTRTQQAPDFDALASEMASAIQEATRGTEEGVGVLVLDFQNRIGPASELDRELTAEFADSLRKHSRHFLVLNRDDLQQAMAEWHLPEAALTDPGAMKCLAPELRAKVIVEGMVEYAPDGAVLQIEARLVRRRESLFGKNVVVPIPPQMKAFISKPAPPPEPFFITEERTWINPDHPPMDHNVVLIQEPGEKRFVGPRCGTCSMPEFSEDALWARLQGTVVLNVQILADGIPARVSLVKGLPCGLTEKAFDAVEHWKFKPAIRADGMPVPVEVPVEVVFRMY